MRVLVTNAKNRISYNIVRSLAGKGIEVYCADFVPRAMCFYSRYSSCHFLYPSPFREQERFVAHLIAKIQELKIDVLMPVFEELFVVAKHKTLFSQHVKLAVPDYEQVLTAHNKDKWEPLAAELQIPVPRSFIIESLLADHGTIRALPYPVLIKPKQGGGGWGIRRLNSAAEMETLLAMGSHQGLPWERFLIQQLIKGETLCVAMVFNQGRLRGKVAYRQIREYPLFGGQATCRISVANAQSETYLQRLLEHLRWHGVCQADFVIDAKSGIPYLIDINPRFWGSLAQGIAAGVDFPHLVSQIAFRGDVEPVVGFRTGVMTRWLGGELRGFPAHYRQAESKLSFLRQFFWPPHATALFDDFNRADPIPFLAWGMDSISRVIKHKTLQPHDALAGIWE